MPLLELGQRGPVGVQLLDRGGDRPVQPLGLAAGRAGLRAELAELLGDGGHPGVRLVQPVQRGLRRRGSRAACSSRRGLQREPDPLDPVAGLDQAGTRPRRRRPAPRAGSAWWPSRRRRARGRARRRRGDRHQAGCATRPAAARPSRSSATTTSASSRVSGRSQDVGRRDEVERAARVPAGRSAGSRRAGRRPGRRCRPAGRPGPASSSLSSRIAADRRADVADRDRVGGRAERRGDRRLVAGLDGAAARRPSRARRRAGRRRPARCRRRPCAPGPARAPPCARPGRRARARRPAPRRAARRPRPRPRPAASAASSWSASRSSSPSSSPATWVSRLVNSAWARRGALARLRPGRGLSRPISASRGLDPAARGGDLAGQPGQALAAVGGRARQRRPPGAARRPAPPRPPGGRSTAAAEGLALAADAGLDLGLLGAQPRGLAPRAASGSRPGRSSSGAAARCRTRSAARLPVPRNRSRSDDSRYQVSWARASVGASAAATCSSSASRSLASARAASTSARRARSAVSSATSASSVARELDQVVGEQAQPRVAQVGLDDGGPPGHLGLPAQRLELAAQLGGEVLHPGEVGLHRVELAERLLLALAVLEDAGGLLDEAAALLRAGGQDGVELALADDDVHLAADAASRRAAPGRRAAGRAGR